MTADFKLLASGPEVPCDFPGCTANAFHDGDHLLAAKPKPLLTNRIYICRVCKRGFKIYGEHLPVEFRTCGDQACIIELARREALELPLPCSCPQRAHPHDVSVHAKLRSESYNPQRRFRWPWSLAISPRVEPSTERKAA